MKIKSHAGCWMNERADEKAEELAVSNVSRDEMTRWCSTCGDGVLLPRESDPSRPPVGRQNGGCWMPFEYAYGGRQLCNSRLDRPRMVRGPGPSREGLGLDARWETFVSHELKKIAIVDLCRPSDLHPEQLKAAAIRKQDRYAPLVLALCHYFDEGWTVQVFLWVVGILGLINSALVASLLTFLDIPSRHRKTAVERTVLASVKALYFMHQVRFGGMYGRQRAADIRQNNSSDDEVTDDEELRSEPSGRRGKRLARRPAESLLGRSESG
jgi:hypothetical protein